MYEFQLTVYTLSDIWNTYWWQAHSISPSTCKYTSGRCIWFLAPGVLSTNVNEILIGWLRHCTYAYMDIWVQTYLYKIDWICWWITVKWCDRLLNINEIHPRDFTCMVQITAHFHARGTWFVCSILRELAVSNLGQPLFCLSITWSRCRNAYRDLWIMTITNRCFAHSRAYGSRCS